MRIGRDDLAGWWLYGDVVEFTTGDHSGFGTSTTREYGARIVGRLTNESTARILGDGSGEGYLVSIFGHTVDRFEGEDVDRLLEWGHDTAVSHHDDGSLVLRWGDPPDSPKDVYCVKPARGLRRLLTMAECEEFRKLGHCPRCGNRGEWRSLALVCPWHGIFV